MNTTKMNPKKVKEWLISKSNEPFVYGVGVVLLLEFVLYPLLDVSNTFWHLLAGALGVGLAYLVYKYLEKRIFSDIEEKELGETELDYLPMDYVPPKKKKPSKKARKELGKTNRVR